MYFLISSWVIIICGVVCVIIHVYLWGKESVSRLTPYLPAGAFLILNGLLNLKLNYEIIDGGAETQTILLPFKLENDDTEMMSVVSADSPSVHYDINV